MTSQVMTSQVMISQVMTSQVMKSQVKLWQVITSQVITSQVTHFSGKFQTNLPRSNIVNTRYFNEDTKKFLVNLQGHWCGCEVFSNVDVSRDIQVSRNNNWIWTHSERFYLDGICFLSWKEVICTEREAMASLDRSRVQGLGVGLGYIHTSCMYTSCPKYAIIKYRGPESEQGSLSTFRLKWCLHCWFFIKFIGFLISKIAKTPG